MTEVTATRVVHAAALTFELDAERGVFHLSSPVTGRRIASDLECAVRFAEGTVRSRGTRGIWRPLPGAEGQGLEVQFCTEGEIHLILLVRVDELAGGLALTLTAANHGSLRT